MSGFVHLHLHSEYSLLDGACRISDIPRAAKEAGHKAVAITDHGNMFGVVDFYNACKAEGIKPIIGCEVYLAPDSRFSRSREDGKYYHLILLVKNEIGYKNLICLVSKAYTEGFYSKPRIDMELLASHSEGLIALSACIAGYIPQAILRGDIDAAREHALKMRSIFEPDCYYLEIQDHSLEDEKTVCRSIAEISRELGIPMAATNDVHYINRTDAEKQAVLMCIQTNTRLSDGSPIGFETDEFYYKSTSEMESLFGRYEGAVENTVKIADMCEYDFDFKTMHLPSFPVPAGETAQSLLKKLAEQGLKDRTDNGDITFDEHTYEDYKFRLIYELMIITKMGYCDYFLIVRDFVNWAKDHNIPTGPGRGSGAGSLIAYLLRITEIDSIKYNLLFERFLNPERVSMPDFDIDFCYNRRDEVIKYVCEKYGSDHVSQIAAFGTLAARAAVRDVGRALAMPYNEVDRVAKLIPREMNITIAAAIKQKELKELYDSDPSSKRLLDISMSLEGMPRHVSTHAAGIVITKDPVYTYVPLATSGEAVLTQFEMNTVSKLGLLKFDFLALRYLTVIDDAEKQVRKTEPGFNISKIPLDDAASYKLISDGLTEGVFQLESAGMRRLLVSLVPTTIEDIMLSIALYRPGPMDSIPKFLSNRADKSKIKYKIPQIAEILDETSGCIVYQEQVMQIFRKVAGYSYGRADTVRKIMAKKKAAEMEGEREGFLSGAAKNFINREDANELFDEMAGFASYAFNKSHAAAYSYISYRTAYLKAHYPGAYFAALLTSVSGNPAKTAEYISDCTKMGIHVLPPDINESGKYFDAKKNNITFGFYGIKNIGESFAENIISERNSEPFASFTDFIRRMIGKGLNKQQLYSLICSGAFDSFGKYRSQLLGSYEEQLSSISVQNVRKIDGQIDLLTELSDSSEKNDLDNFDYPDIPELPVKAILAGEKEMTGLYFSGHLLDDYTMHTGSLNYERIAAVTEAFNEESESYGSYHDKQQVVICSIVMKITLKQTKNNDTMAFVTVEDKSGEIEIVIFPSLLNKTTQYINDGAAVCISGTISSKEDDAPKLLAGSIVPLIPNREFRSIRESSTVSNVSTKKADETTALSRQPQKLFLKVPDTICNIYRRALAVCEIFEGQCLVIFFDASTSKYLKTDIKTEISEFVKKELSELLGSENVIIK